VSGAQQKSSFLMASLIASFVAEHPNAVALVDASGHRTWRELDERVDALVGGLRRRGLRDGDTIAAMVGNQREAVELALACLHGGWLLVPVNWHWVAPELAYVLADCDAAALVVGDAWTTVAVDALALLDAERGPRVRVVTGASEPPSGFESFEVIATGGDEPGDEVRGGVMFYTSGTTGSPKGVRGALAEVGGSPVMWAFIGASIATTLHVTPPDAVQLLCGPMYHSAQFVSSVGPLLAGATLVMQHRFDGAEVLELVDRHRVTNLHLVPAQMVRLLRVDAEQRARFDGSSVRAVFHGAAPCPQSVKRAMIEWWGPKIWEYYGGTEGGFISVISADEWSTRPTSVGRPLETVELLVVDGDGRRLGPGEVGDLYFRSLLGSDFRYHNADDKTAAAHLEPGVGTLGDIGFVDDEGYLHLSDRRIDMIISGGVNIYPAEIESVLSAHHAVSDVAVFGIPDDEMGERVMAVVEPAASVASDGVEALFAELEAHCRRELAGYKCPRHWELRDALPRNDAGKLAKRLLRDPYWEGRDTAI
jgi:long-chain acyl-CoA synthetase